MKKAGVLTSRIILLTAMFMMGINAYSQLLQATLSHYSTDDGLASNAISDIKQDDYGYIWIATWNGLSRFDGFNFYNYETGNRSHIPLLHNRIIDIKIDQSQNIWLRMYDGRVYVLNRITDKIGNAFNGLTGYQNFKTSSQITVTSSGDMLVIVNDIGIYKMRLDAKGMKSQLINTAQLNTTSIVEGYKGDIWVGTNKGIHRLNMNDEVIDRKGVFLDESIKCMFSNGFNIYAGTISGKILSFAYGQEPKTILELGQTIQSVFVDSHNILWFTTSKHGVSRLNLETGDMKDFTQTVLVPEYDVNGATISEVNGTVWVSMNHGGFGYYNRETDEVEYFHNNPANSWNLSNTVSTYLALPEGVVLESTSRKGLEKLDLLKKTIRRIQLFPDAESSNINEVRAMYYDKDTKRLLVGNKQSSLFFFNGPESEKVITEDGLGNKLGRIYGINKDSKGNYWICSKGTGLIKMTPFGDSFHMTLFKNNEKDPMSLSSDNPYCTVEDKKGNIWVATYGGGVNILTKRPNGKYMFLNSKNVMRHYPYNSYNKVRTLTLDKDGNVWAGTTDGLLLMSYDNNRVRIQKISETLNAEQELNSKDIVCLACDNKGTVWIGTNGGGLSCTKGKDDNGNWKFETFDSRNGLPSEEIKSITFDQQGNVWFATDHMLCSFNTEKRILSTFSILDGVDDTICSEGAAIVLPNGNIVFGTLDGFYYVDKKKLTNSSGSMLKLKITDFFIDDKLTSPRYSDSIPYYVPDSKDVELPSRKSGFAFRFASLNYQLQHRVHYQYMLEGYDEEWINAGKDRIAKYEDIPAGTYMFKVTAFLLESPDAFDLRIIEVTVPSYFLLSSDAIWIYMFVVALALLSFVYFKQERLAQRMKSKEHKHPEYTSPGASGNNTSKIENVAESNATENTHSKKQEQTPISEDIQTIEVEYIDDTKC